MPGDKFMPEMYLKQARFTYNHCGPFTKYKDLKKQEIQDIFIETNYIKRDMAYGDLKDLQRKIASDKVLCDKSFNIAKNLNMWIWCTSCLKKKSASPNIFGYAIKGKIMSNQKSATCLADELHKPIIRKFI